jgi:hypothetical protein
MSDLIIVKNDRNTEEKKIVEECLIKICKIKIYKELVEKEKNLENIDKEFISIRSEVKCLMKSMYAFNKEAQKIPSNEILNKCRHILGKQFYIGMPHLRVHFKNDYKEESKFHTDERDANGIKLTLWTPINKPKKSQYLKIINIKNKLLSKLINKSKYLMELFSNEIEIDEKQSIIFNAKLIHRGNRNKYNIFYSKVVRITQFPYAEQGYIKIVYDGKDFVELERKNYFTQENDENDENFVNKYKEIISKLKQNKDKITDNYVLNKINKIDYKIKIENGDAIIAMALGELSTYHEENEELTKKLLVESYILNPASGFIIKSLMNIIKNNELKERVKNKIIESNNATLIMSLAEMKEMKVYRSELLKHAIRIDSNYKGSLSI